VQTPSFAPVLTSPAINPQGGLQRRGTVILHRMWIDGTDFRFTDKSEVDNRTTAAV
jgi:hypothetical protein